MEKEGIMQISGGQISCSPCWLISAGGRERQEHNEGGHDRAQQDYISVFALHNPAENSKYAVLAIITHLNSLPPYLTHLLHVIYMVRNDLSSCFSHWLFIRLLCSDFESYEFHVAFI
jgi:hypothetical protein